MEGLLIYKYILMGKGQVVADYAAGKKHFTHEPIQKTFQTKQE
jgi:glutamate-5-semialdehyde dehydrogenase